MRGTTVRDNQASGHFQFGGAVYVDSAPATISRSTFARNTAVGSVQGGGLFVGGVSRVSATTFVGNVLRTAVSGDQVYGSAALVAGTGTLLIASSTMSGNRLEADPADVSDTASGAVATFGQPLTLRGSTLSGNTATNVPGGFPDSGSLGGTSAIDLVNTIVAGGTPTNCGATARTASHSIDTDGSCAIGTTNGNLTGVNPLLAPLAANGGPTLTHAIGATSPARDAADLATCLATDQRGVVRPQRSGCDIGAFELEPALPGPPVLPGPGARPRT